MCLLQHLLCGLLFVCLCRQLNTKNPGELAEHLRIWYRLAALILIDDTWFLIDLLHQQAKTLQLLLTELLDYAVTR